MADVGERLVEDGGAGLALTPYEGDREVGRDDVVELPLRDEERGAGRYAAGAVRGEQAVPGRGRVDGRFEERRADQQRIELQDVRIDRRLRAAVGDALDRGDRRGGDDAVERELVDLRPRDERVRGDDVAHARAREAMEQIFEVRRRGDRGDARELKFRRVARGELAREERSLAALGVAPGDELRAGIGRELARGPDGIEDGLPFAAADQVRMRPGGPKPRIVGGDDDVAARDQIGEVGDGGVDFRAAQGGRAALRDARRRVRPGDDRAPAGGRLPQRHDHDAGDGDPLAVDARRGVEQLPGARAGGRRGDRFRPDDVPRGELRDVGRSRIERIASGQGRCCAREDREREEDDPHEPDAA